MIRRPPRSTQGVSSAASDVYKRQVSTQSTWGRPGWHIECSAMASDMFKVPEIDIHSGGIDLRFPHHDNEMAQAEAYYECNNWVKYFLHSGHLEIEGQKMSKSLKNFISIKKALTTYTGRQIRLMTLAHRWDVTFNYTEKAMPEAVKRDKKISEYFLNVKTLLRNISKDIPQKWNEKDFKLYQYFEEIREKIHKALCDNIDTPAAILLLLDLISAGNTYMKDEATIKPTLLMKLTNYVQFILQAFGYFSDNQMGASTEKEGGAVDEEAIITPLMNAFAKFRDDIKANAKSDPKTLFNLCDQLRDVVLPELGIRIEDGKKDQASKWKKEDPEKIKAEAKKKEEEKVAKEEEKKKKAAEDLKKKMTPAKEYFAQMTDKYSAFDAEGLPTHDASGKELSKELKNKLKKEYQKQDKLHKKWLEDEKKKGSAQFLT
eukprot:TRINITY_DN222_c0_g2_i3.p1 TRINITY_DN222_c0_g2~~TRINITY_DN222_c0_g2_i3.p1  ORF type:complete len:431 (+),score=123.35 TRINITY_DN222_c0_g2_i3:137-1429(+)